MSDDSNMSFDQMASSSQFNEVLQFICDIIVVASSHTFVNFFAGIAEGPQLQKPEPRVGVQDMQ